MEDEEAGIAKVSKRFAEKEGEVDYKTKSGTAWSHNFLNQKPWHPLSYPNQRRKWIAEQTHAQRERRTDEVAREYAQEQDFLRQTSLLSHKEKQKVDLMQAVSFMYVRPPGYNAESAKAAEIIEERRKAGETDPAGATSSSVPQETAPVKEEKKKPRPKDVFGRSLPTEEEFAVLKNAPRLETGVTGRAKPFGVEVRNVKCARCGAYGHQSGDRECPMKDAIMPNEESRLKRDDPLTAIIAHMDSSEPLKWELKQKPGISPPRGGFQPDDPNQQIVAEDEDIFDEYGGFLSGGGIPELLTNFSSKKHKKKKNRSKSKHKKRRSSRSSCEESSSDSEYDKKHSKTESRSKHMRKTSVRPRYEGDNHTSDGDNCRTNSIPLKNKKRSSRSSCEESSSDSEYDKKHVKRESRSKHVKKTSARPRYEGDNHASDGDNGRTSSVAHKIKKRSSRSSCEESSSDSEYDKKHAKTESRSKHRKKTSARPRYEGDNHASDGDNGRTNSIPQKNKKRSSPGDSDEASDVYRKSTKQHMHKERNKKSSSHLIMSDGSGDERYITKNRSHNRSLQADDMESKKDKLSNRRSRESRKPHDSSLSDSERKLRSKDKRYRDQKSAKSDAGYSSPENSGPDRHGQKHEHSSSKCNLTEKLESDRYRSRHRR